MPAELHSMRNDWPPLIKRGHDAVDDMVSRFQAVAAAVESSPSHSAVADHARKLAGEAAKLHDALRELDSMSRTADSTQWQSAEEVEGRHDPEAWHRQ